MQDIEKIIPSEIYKVENANEAYEKAGELYKIIKYILIKKFKFKK